MQKQVSLIFLGIVAVTMIYGCGSSEPSLTTPAEKKAFAGGPMPPDAQKKFVESQKQSAALIAKHQADSKAAAGH